MKLRRSQEFHVEELNLGGSEGSIKDAHETCTRGTGIPSKNDTRRIVHLDVNFLDEFIVDIPDIFKRGVCEFGGVCFPFGLTEVSNQMKVGDITSKLTSSISPCKSHASASNVFSAAGKPTSPTIGSTNFTPLSSAGL